MDKSLFNNVTKLKCLLGWKDDQDTKSDIEESQDTRIQSRKHDMINTTDGDSLKENTTSPGRKRLAIATNSEPPSKRRHRRSSDVSLIGKAVTALRTIIRSASAFYFTKPTPEDEVLAGNYFNDVKRPGSDFDPRIVEHYVDTRSESEKCHARMCYILRARKFGRSKVYPDPIIMESFPEAKKLFTKPTVPTDNTMRWSCLVMFHL